MNLIARLVAAVALATPHNTAAFTVQPGKDNHQPRNSVGGITERRTALVGITSIFFGSAVFPANPSPANADVSDGNSLPQGAAQFARVVRLQSDLKKVKKRVADEANEIDRAEWENVSQFLRLAYATGDDMKAIAGGIYNPDNKKRALQDVEQLRKYAQAGDIAVTKRDGPGFVGVADKMSFLVSDFLDSLSDVPDEI